MKLGFIGCGNMAQAMIKGILDHKGLEANQIMAAGPTQEKMDAVKEQYGISTTCNNQSVAKEADIFVLSVKPQMYETVIKDIKECVSREQIIVTIAAGVSMEQVERFFGQEMKIIRTMPNTPAMVGEAMVGMCSNDYVSEDELHKVKALFENFGKVEVVSESLMDAVVGVSGSSPAYVYMFIEALADAAVLEGIPRNQAYTFAAQSVLGSAKMVLETGQHPGALKDAVCSPGGTTIEAVRTLEDMGMRSAVMEALKAAADKSRDLGK